MIDETKIMQYADGTLPAEEREEVKKAIETDPKLKELYNSFQETGDLLFKLGNEIKSQPLPKNLQEKADIIKTWKKPIAREFGSFNFGSVSIAFLISSRSSTGSVPSAYCIIFVSSIIKQLILLILFDNLITYLKQFLNF